MDGIAPPSPGVSSNRRIRSADVEAAHLVLSPISAARCRRAEGPPAARGTRQGVAREVDAGAGSIDPDRDRGVILVAVPRVETIRFALAVPAGVLVMGAAVGALEAAGHALFPAGPGMTEAIDLMRRGDPSARDALARAIAALSVPAKASIVFAWTAGAAFGTLASCRVAGSRQVPLAISIGVITMIFVAANLVAIPHPASVAIAGIALPPLAAIGVGRLLRGVVRSPVARG